MIRYMLLVILITVITNYQLQKKMNLKSISYNHGCAFNQFNNCKNTQFILYHIQKNI